MGHKYKKTDWDIVAVRKQDGVILTEGKEFDDAISFHLDETKDYHAKSSYYPEIYSVRNNIRKEILSLGDDTCITTDMSPYEEIRNLPTRSHGKITRLWSSFEQMRIDVGNGGMPLSEITGKFN